MTLTDSEILDLVYLRHLHALPDNRKEPEEVASDVTSLLLGRPSVARSKSGIHDGKPERDAGRNS